MTHNKICSYCGQSHAVLDSDVVCDTFMAKLQPEPLPPLTIGNFKYGYIKFKFPPKNKKKSGVLSRRMSSSIKKFNKAAK